MIPLLGSKARTAPPKGWGLPGPRLPPIEPGPRSEAGGKLLPWIWEATASKMERAIKVPHRMIPAMKSTHTHLFFVVVLVDHQGLALLVHRVVVVVRGLRLGIRRKVLVLLVLVVQVIAQSFKLCDSG